MAETCFPPLEPVTQSDEDDAPATLLFDAHTSHSMLFKRKSSLSNLKSSSTTTSPSSNNTRSIPLPTTPTTPRKPDKLANTAAAPRPQSMPVPSTKPSATTQPSLFNKPEGKKLRLFISASGLRWPVKLRNGTGPGGVNRNKLIYAKVYLQEGPRVNAPHNFSAISAVTAVSDGNSGTASNSAAGTAAIATSVNTNTNDNTVANTNTTMSYDRYHMMNRSTESSRPSDDYRSRSDKKKPQKVGKKGKLLGYTEKALICGRDVEFVKNFSFTYNKNAQPVINLEIYGLPNPSHSLLSSAVSAISAVSAATAVPTTENAALSSSAADAQGNTINMNTNSTNNTDVHPEPNLIGTASFPLSDLYEGGNCGKVFPVALLPPPPPVPTEPETKRAAKRRQRKAHANVGCVNVAVEHLPLGRKPRKYYLDIQCAAMQRPTTLGKKWVKNAHYTIHTVGREDNDNNSRNNGGMDNSNNHIDGDMSDTENGEYDSKDSSNTDDGILEQQRSNNTSNNSKERKNSKRGSRRKERKAEREREMRVEEEKRRSNWVLLYRSKKVGLVKRKRDGGSMEYNYFSSRPLLATPGELFRDPPEEELAADNSTNNKMIDKVRKEMQEAKKRVESQFFSMPSGLFTAVTPTRPLKLSILDETNTVLADTTFTIDTLRQMQLGDKLAMKERENKKNNRGDGPKNNNNNNRRKGDKETKRRSKNKNENNNNNDEERRIVGHSMLKFVEKADQPAYFCLSVSLPELVKEQNKKQQ